MTQTDTVTGARTEVSLLVDLPMQRLWDLVTDVARYGEWSPECEHTGWLDAAEGRPPRVGDRFAGRNRFGKDFVTSVVCGETGARAIAQDDPAGLDRRLTVVRRNMAVSLAAMLGRYPR